MKMLPSLERWCFLSEAGINQGTVYINLDVKTPEHRKILFVQS